MKGNYTACVASVRVMIGAMVLLQRFVDVNPDEIFQAQGAVNSSITLPCETPEGFSVETIRWYLNASVTPFLTYFHAENFVAPPNHDPRYSITDPDELNISNLTKSDSGLYTCRITFLEARQDLEQDVGINVLDGCAMWAHSAPLLSTSWGCSTGDLVPYAKQCSFTCEEGFHLVGNSSTECQGNGELTNQLPYCEAVTCNIDNLPSNLVDLNMNCRSGASVDYWTICDFECISGYSLRGNGTVPVTCVNGYVPYLPECEDESRRLSSGHIALICLVILLISAFVVGVFLWKLRRPNKEKADEEGNENSPLMIKTYGGFMEYLVGQIGESYAAINMILLKLEQAEMKNIPKLSRMMFKENKAPATPSIPRAFVWYVAEIVRCIDGSNPGVGSYLMTDILSSTEEITSKGSKTTASVGSLKQDQGDGNKTYFDVVHRAFENLLIVLQRDMTDKQVVKERTTKVCTMMKTSFKEKKQEIKNAVMTATPKRYEEITLNWDESSDGANFFAKMCLRNIDMFVDFNDKIHMRSKILQIMIGSADDTNMN